MCSASSATWKAAWLKDQGKRFTLGELDGKSSTRVGMIAGALTRAGFKAPVIDGIRAEIWLKVLGNMSFNPISALTHATLVDLLKFPTTRELCIAMMREAEQVANKLGVTFRVGERCGAGHHRTHDALALLPHPSQLGGDARQQLDPTTPHEEQHEVARIARHAVTEDGLGDPAPVLECDRGIGQDTHDLCVREPG